MARTRVTERLAENPRLIGALFTTSSLLMNVGNVLAGSGAGTSGP